MCWKKGSWQPVLWTLWGLHKLSTHELLCTGQNPGQMSLFQRMWGTKTWFCFSYRGSLTTRTEYQGWNQPAIITISKMKCWGFLNTIQIPDSERQRAWALLWLSWSAGDLNSHSTELISQPCLKPPSALGVFGCPLLHKEDQHRPTYTNISFSKKYTHSNALGEMPQVLKTSS